MATAGARTAIKKAVYRDVPSKKQAVLDRLFAVWFARFVYNQIWEDPAIDLEALALGPGHRVVTIASGGCNILNYLTADPASIDAVDLNPAHIALTRLKIGAMRHLPSYDDFFRFFGIAKNKEECRSLLARSGAAARCRYTPLLGEALAARPAAHRVLRQGPLSQGAARQVHRLPPWRGPPHRPRPVQDAGGRLDRGAAPDLRSGDRADLRAEAGAAAVPAAGAAL